MTQDERDAYQAICGHVTMTPASWDKRFFRQLQPEAISEKEAPQLWRLFIRYRRQTVHPRKAELLRLAAGLSAPDYRKQQAAMNAQARIDELKRRYQEAMQPTA